MDCGAEIECLEPATSRVAIRELCAHTVQDRVIGPDRLTNDQWARVFERLVDLFPTGYLADADIPSIILENNDVTGKKRTVCAAYVKKHAVGTSERSNH